MCKENLGCLLTEKCTNEERIRADERAKTIDRIINCVALPKSAKKLIEEMAKDVLDDYEKEQKNEIAEFEKD